MKPLLHRGPAPPTCPRWPGLRIGPYRQPLVEKRFSLTARQPAIVLCHTMLASLSLTGSTWSKSASSSPQTKTARR